MSNAASAYLNPIAAELEGVGLRSATLSRRVRQRRHTLAIQAVSYALGASVLLLYAHAGTISLFGPLPSESSGPSPIAVADGSLWVTNEGVGSGGADGGKPGVIRVALPTP